VSAKRHKLARRLVKLLGAAVKPSRRRALCHQLADNQTPSELRREIAKLAGE